MAWYESFGLIFRSLIKTENKPKQLDHGANWNSPHGERAPYDPSKALSSYGLHSWTHAAVSRQAQDLAALPLKLMTGKGADAQQIDDHPGENEPKCCVTAIGGNQIDRTERNQTPGKGKGLLKHGKRCRGQQDKKGQGKFNTRPNAKGRG